MKAPLVSIIMPAYNAEQYIEAAIESVLNLSVPSWELIVVDDGSSDTTAEICRKYMLLNPKIKYIYQSNAGVSVARNAGISQARGKWISFLDADDLLFHNALDAISTIDDTCEYIVLGYTRNQSFKEARTHKISRVTSFEMVQSIFSISSFLKAHPENRVIDCYNALSVWGRFFRRDLIVNNAISFPIGIRQSEDTLFCLDYCLHISNAEIIDDEIYYYRPNENSVTNQFADYFEENIIRVFNQLSTYNLSGNLETYLASYIINYVTNCVMLYYLDSRSSLPFADAGKRLQNLCEMDIVVRAIKNCRYRNIAYGKHHMLYNTVLLLFLKRKQYIAAIWTLDKLIRII